MNDVMNDAIDQIIINLKTIGKLKMNDKLYIFNGYVMIQKESFYRSFVRKVYGYSREQSCQLIEEIVQKAIRSAVVLFNIQNIQRGENVLFLNYLKILIQFREAFSMCKDGLNNFLITYSDDLTIVSRIENLISHINNQLTLIDTKLENEDYRVFVVKYFPQKLEQFITTSHTPLNSLQNPNFIDNQIMLNHFNYGLSNKSPPIYIPNKNDKVDKQVDKTERIYKQNDNLKSDINIIKNDTLSKSLDSVNLDNNLSEKSNSLNLTLVGNIHNELLKQPNVMCDKYNFMNTYNNNKDDCNDNFNINLDKLNADKDNGSVFESIPNSYG
jgi:hypothetical protein